VKSNDVKRDDVKRGGASSRVDQRVTRPA